MEEQRPSGNPNDCKTAIVLLRENHERNDGSLPSLNELRDSEELSVEEKTLLFKSNESNSCSRKASTSSFHN